MSERQPVVFLVIAADDERLLRLGLWVVSAASIGDPVEILLTSRPLREWVDGSFGEEAGGARAAGKVEGVPSPRQLLFQAKELSRVRILSCDTEIRLAGLSEDAVRPVIDEIVSLPAFWRAMAGARVVTL